MKRSEYISSLDGWRAIAIIGVILSHSFASNYWTRHGALGVNLFFAISGFLITSRLLDEQTRNGFVSLSQFYSRRAFRILPPALCYLAVITLLSVTGVIYSSGTDIVSCLVFLRNYWGASAHDGWYTGHFWSLAVEEQFYLFWPAILVIAGFRRSRWIAPALALSFAIWRSLDLRNGWIATLFHNEVLRNYPLRSDYRMDALLWGSSLALFGIQRFAPKRFGSGFVLGAFVVIVALDVRQPQSYMLAEALLFPFLLAVTVAQPGAWFSRALECVPLRWCGRLSYSLYLWQQLFVSQYHHGVFQRFPINVVLAVFCALGSYYFVERPAIKWGRRLNKPTHAEPPLQAMAVGV